MKLHRIRESWCRTRPRRILDVCGFEVILDCERIHDIPSLFIEWGRLINGSSGYYGACLDSLDDCLCGSFGARPPFTVTVIKKELGFASTCGDAEHNWHLCWERRALDEGLLTEQELRDLGHPISANSSQFVMSSSYLERFLELLQLRGVEVKYA